MRVLLDKNIFISYLLRVSALSAVNRIVEAAVQGDFLPLTTIELLEELIRKVSTKKYLARRIPPILLEDLIDLLALIGEAIPPSSARIPSVSRDPKDDYLLAYALVGKADYLVTGDEDLLILGGLVQVKIVTPSAFLSVITTT